MGGPIPLFVDTPVKPEHFIGAAGKMAVCNDEETGLEFTDAISVDVTDFDGAPTEILSASDTTVQAALETINDVFKTAHTLVGEWNIAGRDITADGAIIDALAATYAAIVHDHDLVYAALAHTHDDRYYTETESDLAYAAIAHDHDLVYLGIAAQAADSVLLDGENAAHYHAWANVTDPPAMYAPTAHASDHTDGTDDIASAGAAQKGVVDTAAQTWNGVKTFGSFPVTPSAAPTADYEVANKKYVDDAGGGGALADLSDVTITSVADNEVLAYDTTTSKWINQTPAEAGLLGLAGGTLTGNLLVPTGTVLLPAIARDGDPDTGIYFGERDAIHLTAGRVNYLSVGNGNVCAHFPLQVPDGSAAAPGLYCSFDANTGFYWTGSDDLCVTAGGTLRMTVADTAVTLAVPLYMAAYGIGNDAAVMTFGAGATGAVTVTGNIVLSTALATVDGRDVSVDGAKLDGIEATADVTDATNVNAAGATMNADTDVSANGWVVDEDDMASDLATKVPTQQSVKAYVDASGGGGGATVVYKAADEIVNNSTTFQDDDALLFAVEANHTYRFHFFIQWQSNTTSDIKFQLTGPAGCTNIRYAGINFAGITTGQNAWSVPAVQAGSADELFQYVGTVEVGATPGAITLQWAANALLGLDTTVYRGSFLLYEDIT